MRSVVLPRTRRSVLAMIAAALATGCGEPAARVRLVPRGGDCGRPVGGNAVKVTAYTASGEHSQSLALDQTLAIDSFPADTEQIGIEVIVGGGATGAEGKSAPLVFGALPDRAMIPVLMAPPDGFCELPPMTEPRAQPLVAPAGAGALVVGGIGPDGPLSTAEYYDPRTASFVKIDVPGALIDDQGFTGAALATLPDGTVALLGGPQRAFVVFDPGKPGFVAAPTLIDGRAFHAAIATGDQEVLVAGGCSEVSARQCSGVARLQTVRYRIGQLDQPVFSAVLAPGFRIGAELFDLGVQGDGERRYLLAGGTGAPGRADRFALDDATAEGLPGGHVRAAALDGGAVLTAFADDAAAADGAASVYAPGGPAAQPVASAPALVGARLIALEDGRVMGFGGDALGRVQIYDPTSNAWRTELAASPAQTGALTAPSLARLADGTVLVVGGALSAQAWLYRPSLVGPASGSVIAMPASDAPRGVLTAPDPATVTRVTGQPRAWLLATPPGAAMARALVGGPRTATGSVRAIVQVVSGGVALIAQQVGPGQAILAELAPGSPPRLVRLDGGTEHELCSAASPIAAFDPAIPVRLRLEISDHDVRLSIEDGEVLACNRVVADRGAWGVAALGAGAQIAVASVTVAR